MDLKISKAYTPALTCDSEDRIWVAWTVFNAKDHRTTLCARHCDGSIWSDDLQIASSTDGIIQPAMTSDPGGGVWLFWTERRGGIWDVYARRVTPAGVSSGVNLTEHDAQDFAPAATTDAAGRVWVAWQSKRNGNFDVYVCHSTDGRWSPPLCVTEGGSSNWRPAIAADREGGVWVAWDSFGNRAYDVYLRHIGPGPSPLTDPDRITTTRNHDLEASIGVDSEGGVWAVWRRTAPWGKDSYYLNVDGQLCLVRYDAKERRLGLPAMKDYTYRGRCADYGVVPVPVDLYRRELPILPVLLLDRHDAAHLFYRRFRDYGVETGYAWSVEHLVYSGDRWSEIETLSPEMGYGSERIAATMDRGGGIWVGLQGCPWNHVYHRPGEEPDSTVYVERIQPAVREKAAIDSRPGTARVLVPPTSLEDLNFCRSQRHPSRDGYVLIWGDLHRHSIYSSCKPYRDGNLDDHYRWAYDAGEQGFYVTTDHLDTMNRYTWAQANAYADLFNSEGDLVTLYGFESTYPNWGQANHYFIDRGISEVAHRAGLMESFEESLKLYDEENVTDKVFVARHYHGSLGKEGVKDWRPKYEPLFEVVQARGFCLGVMEAILSQGIRMGVNGGCDHSNPPGGVMPWKYSNAMTGLWVKAITREEVFAALKGRRSYATNGKKIGLFFEMDGHIMGEEYTASGPPRVHVEAEATTEIERIELIRDGEMIFSRTDCGRQASVTYTDRDVQPGDHYYYVKLIQQEEPTDNYKGMAVTSAIWVKKT